MLRYGPCFFGELITKYLCFGGEKIGVLAASDGRPLRADP
jgi:hypothetical protein